MSKKKVKLPEDYLHKLVKEKIEQKGGDESGEGN